MSEVSKKWIWPFELLDKLGEGGMGVVYRARYVKNDKLVAVKILPDDISDPVILGRFDRELEILRKLRHPNIVHCFGGTTEGEHRFYAMEIVEGGGLDRLLMKRGALPWELAVKYAQQMAAALEYAHDHDVTHRDVKPGNFLIAKTGQLKLSDFGLATFTTARNLTAAGKTMGTFRYMAPEQIRGKEVGPKADLYSLGCVLYEMVTGQPPFDGDSPAEILDQHLHQEAPRVTSLVFDCPASLDQLIKSLLEKDPAKRPASAHEVARALAEVSPVVMVSTSPMQDARTQAEILSPTAGREWSLWTVPRWLMLTLIAVPLLWMSWTLSLRNRAAQADIAFQSWQQVWSKNDTQLRQMAAKPLGELAVHDDRALELLEQGLGASDSGTRVAALQGLAEAGSSAEHLQTTILKMQQQDGEALVRNQAQTTLKSIRSAPEGGGAWAYWLLGGCGILLAGGYLIAHRKYAPQ